MKYRYLGHSGLLVSRICLGTMTFGNTEWGCDLDTSRAIVKAFIEGGGNFIDTADAYSAGESERFLAAIVKDYRRDDLVIATKGFFPQGDAVTQRGLSRKHIVEACEQSLKRLGTDFIDLYQFHGPDPFTPVEESLRAVDDLIRAGKVRYVGCSNWYGWQIARANGIAALKGFEPLVSAQHLYNLVRRDIERDVLPACEAEGVGMICWSPLAAGMLSGKYAGQNAPAEGTRHGIQKAIVENRYWFDEARQLVDKVVEIAGRIGRTPSQVALSWLFGDARVTAAIVGARRIEQLTENLAAGDFELEADVRAELTDAMPLRLGYPHEWTSLNGTPSLDKGEAHPRHTVRMP
ncbi:MAG: aldo/keto reductase [Devosia sp.]|uniref:aldo/keto reductase n=1 Tax=Devosia sp. TaxID=1871048 RepID=UPI001A3B27CD|nr:aldo/keto reductase [Devosia sp.]MBL8597168.1 aldo/keto reductase [Devosia sp.]